MCGWGCLTKGWEAKIKREKKQTREKVGTHRRDIIGCNPQLYIILSFIYF